jgi:hypothetical protein
LFTKNKFDPVGHDPSKVKEGELVLVDPTITPLLTVIVAVTGEVPFHPAAIIFDLKFTFFVLAEITTLKTA